MSEHPAHRALHGAILRALQGVLAMKSVTEEELNDPRTRPDRHRRAGCHIRITAWNNPALVDLVAS